MKAFSAAIVSLILMGSTAFAAPITYQAILSGPNESPANASPGTGFATVTFDLTAHIMTVDVTFSGLVGNTTNAHIHCCTAIAGTGTAGVATQTPTFTGFPAGVTSGSYSNSFNTLLASTYNPSFVTANGGTAASAESALANGVSAGTAYLNIHSSAFPGGEIRGFLVQPVPEPATFVLMGAALLGLAAKRFRTSL